MVKVNKEWIEFRFFRPQSKEVFLVGDFCNWQTDCLRMFKNEDGYWLGYMHLPRGTYKFRYFSDGSWYTDFAAYGVIGDDSLVCVE